MIAQNWARSTRSNRAELSLRCASLIAVPIQILRFSECDARRKTQNSTLQCDLFFFLGFLVYNSNSGFLIFFFGKFLLTPCVVVCPMYFQKMSAVRLTARNGCVWERTRRGRRKNIVTVKLNILAAIKQTGCCIQSTHYPRCCAPWLGVVTLNVSCSTSQKWFDTAAWLAGVCSWFVGGSTFHSPRMRASKTCIVDKF